MAAPGEMRKTRGVLVPDRRRHLLAEVRGRGSIQVEELADILGVSGSTVRRDLALLERDGLLRRAHGGAYVEPTDGRPALPPEPRDDDALHRIGRRAADHVHDGMTVMILGGGTTARMLPYLAGRRVTVVTNGLEVGVALAGFPDVTVVMLGGVLHREQMTLLGPLTVQNMADLHVDVMFGGAWGVDAEGGITGAKIVQAGDHHVMLRHTDALVVLAESSKLGRRGPTLLADLDQVQAVITDRDADPSTVEALRARGLTVDVC